MPPALLVSIGADFSEFDRQMKTIATRLKPVEDVLNKMGSALTKTVTVPIVAAGTALAGTAYAAARFADDIDRMSIQTGLSTKRLQELRYVANQSSTEFTAITSAVGMFTRKLFSSDDEGKASTKVMNELGISVKNADGTFRSMDDIFPEVIAHLANVSNETRRSALASQIFGRGYLEMVPLLKLSSEQLQMLTERAHELGLVESTEGIEAAHKFDHKLDELRQQFSALVREIGASVVPVLQTEFIPILQAKIIPALKSTAEFIAKLVSGFGALPGIVQVAIIAVLGIAAALGPLFLALGQIIHVMPMIIAAFASLGAAAPWLIALGIVVTVLGNEWLLYAAKQAKSEAATKAMTASMLDQSKTIGNLAKKDLPGLIDYYEELIVFQTAARKALEAKYQPTTVMQYNAGLGANVPTTVMPTVTPEDQKELDRYDLVIRGLTATLDSLREAQKGAKNAAKEMSTEDAAVRTIVDQLNAELRLASNRFMIFGNWEELTKQKSDALRKAIEALLVAGIDPFDKRIANLVNHLIEIEHPMERLKVIGDGLKKAIDIKWDPKAFEPIQLEKMESPFFKMLRELRAAKEEEKRIWKQTHQFEMNLIDSLDAGINSSFNELLMIHRTAKNEWDQIWISMFNTAMSGLAAIISQLVTNYIIEQALGATATATTIGEMTAISSAAAPAAALVSMATFGASAGIGTGAVLAGLAAVQLASLPRLGQGGLAYGPSLALVGDNRNASIDPEVIAPLSKLQSMAAPQRIIVEGRFRGRDIYLSGDNYKKSVRRVS